MLQNMSDGYSCDADGKHARQGRRLVSRFRVLGTVMLVAVASLGTSVNAANPHLVSADSTTGDPIFLSPGNVTWNTGLTVPFKIAGLGNNPGLQVKLNARLDLSIGLRATTALNSVVVNTGYTNPSGFNATVTATSTAPGSFSLALAFSQTNPTLTSDKNGQVSGTLAIPGVINATIPDNRACIRYSWTQVTLTINGQAVALPDVTRQFDSNGSSCS